MCRGVKAGDDLVDACCIEGGGCWVVVLKRSVARRDHGPFTLLACLQSSASFPRDVATCFPAGVRKLNACDCALAVEEVRDPRERLNVLVSPDAQIAWRDSAFRGDRGRLDKDEGCAADGATAEMDEVPVVRKSVTSGILAHGRHHDAIAESDTADRQRAEEVNLGNVPIVIGAGSATMSEESRRIMRLS